uniref:Uncharacterized protein n=1 Tax=Aegilops tauschii subsp. strangulata TaxID=200361 RepID=A0A453RUL3_AEGTS
GRNASLLVLKDLQSNKSEKTNGPRLGILQKEMVDCLFSQRKNCWAGHVVRRTTETAQPNLYPSLSGQILKKMRCAILSLIDYTLCNSV